MFYQKNKKSKQKTVRVICKMSIPPFGRLIKRLKMGTDGGIDLVSDNKAYEKRTISYEGYDNVVLGRVAWVWQLF